MTVLHEAFAHELKRQGVTAVFGLVGNDTLKLAVELDRQGIAYYGTRHESGAVGMADGYSRASGELGVALISRGPGVMNGLTALATAAKGRSRLLMIAGDSDPSARGTVYSKYADQQMLYAGAGASFVTIDDADSAVADLAAICERARAGVTMVANVRGEILDEQAGDAPSRAVLPADPAGGDPDPETISFLADLLVESWAFRRPLILGGRGAVMSGAKADLQRLGELCGALLGTTLMARSLFDGDEFNIGICGTFSTDPAIELLQEADTVLAFGTSLDVFTTLNGAMFPKTRLILFDRDASAATAGSVPVELLVQCDAQRGAAALAAELERRVHKAVGYRVPATAAKIESFRSRPLSDQGQPGALDPRLVMQRFNEILPPDRTLVIDIGHSGNFAAKYLSVPEPSAFVFPLENFHLGASTGIALGASVARPDRLTVYAAGDAGLMMTLAEIETAVRYSLPLLILVINDSAIGTELHMLRLWGLPDEIGLIPTPSFQAVAEALGADGFTVTSLDDVEQLRSRVQRLDRPLVVDIPVTTEVRSEMLDADFELSGLTADPSITSTA
jgi:acetolactate synthase I/II/III large subunit